MLDLWGKVLLLLPHIGFYFYFLPRHFHGTAKKEETDVKYSRAPLKTMKDAVMAFQKGILKKLIWTNFAFIMSIIVNMMRGVHEVNLTVFLLLTSLLILLVSTLVRDTRGHETEIGASALLSICAFAGNAGYILFYDVSWLPSPLLGFVIFFLVMLSVPRILLSLPITKLHFFKSRHLKGVWPQLDKLTILCCIFFVGGIMIAAFGALLYPRSTPTSPSQPYAQRQGFLLFSSEALKSDLSSLHYSIHDINYEKRCADVSVWAKLSIMKRMNNGSAFLVLQVLGEANETSFLMNESPLENFGGNVNVTRSESEGVSYIVAEMPRTNMSDLCVVKIDFKWSRILDRVGVFKYMLVVPFNVAFPDFIHDVGLPEEAIRGDGLLIPDESLSMNMSMAKPTNSTISQILPAPDNQGFAYNKIWFNWDIKSRSDSRGFASVVISLDFESDSMKSQFETSLFYSGLLVGIGIPISVSSLLELLKIRLSKRKG